MRLLGLALGLAACAGAAGAPPASAGRALASMPAPCGGQTPRVVDICFVTVDASPSMRPEDWGGEPPYPPEAMTVAVEAHCPVRGGDFRPATTWRLQTEELSGDSCATSGLNLLLVPAPDTRTLRYASLTVGTLIRAHDERPPAPPVLTPPFNVARVPAWRRPERSPTEEDFGEPFAPPLELRTFRPGEVTRAGDVLALEAVAVLGRDEAPTLVSRLTFAGRRALLIGRLDEASQRMLVRERCGEGGGPCEALRADVLQHPSSCLALPSPELLDAVRPSWVVLHEGDSMLGQPSCPGRAAARARVEAAGARWVSTAAFDGSARTVASMEVDPSDPERTLRVFGTFD